jgi:BMFP domain-containing protein YqiC
MNPSSNAGDEQLGEILKPYRSLHCTFCGRKPYELQLDDLEAAIQAWSAQQVREAEIKARFVELDLLEQAINQGRDMNAYKLQRLADLEARLETIQQAIANQGVQDKEDI